MRLGLLFLIALSGIALALPANYTRIWVFDEISNASLNTTNFTIGAQFVNSTNFVYSYYNSSASSSSTDGWVILRNVSTQDYISSTNYTFYCDNGGHTCYTHTAYYYSDGTSSTSGDTSLGGVGSVMFTYANPNRAKFVNNTVISGNALAGVTRRIENNDIYAINIQSMSYITARGGSVIQVSASGYYPSNYFAFLANDSTLNLTAYLLPTGSEQQTNFVVYNYLGAPIPAVNITIERLYSSNYSTVRQLSTDSVGTAGTYLQYGTSYRITASSAYGSVVLTITPTSSTPIQITFSDWIVINTEHQFDGIRYIITPGYAELLSRENQTVSFDIYSADSRLVNYNLNLYWNNGTLLNGSSGTASGGSLLTVSANLSGHPYREHLYAEFRFNKTNYTEWVINRSYYVNNLTAGNNTIYGAFSRLSSVDGISQNAKSFIGILMMFSIVIGLNGVGLGGSGTMGTLVITALSSGFLWYSGWMDSRIAMVMMLLAAAFARNKGYI